MKVCFTAKIREKYQQALVRDFPDIEFFFHQDLETGAWPDAEVLVTFGRADLPERFLEKLPGVKWIQALTAGVDELPLAQLAQRNVRLTNVKGIHRIQMAEYTLSVMLQVIRQNTVFHDNQKQKVWDPSVRIDELYEKTVTVIGTGDIGCAIAERAQAFGMRTWGVNRSGRKVAPFERVFSMSERGKALQESDFDVLIVPLTEDTRHMIRYEDFQQMKSDAVFINIARGSVVKESDLIRALREGEMKAAVLDVFEHEPLSEDSPLWELPGCIITPHVAGRSPRYTERALHIFRENLQRYCENRRPLRNEIDLAKGY